ncbi:DNA-directed RNA polymerase subunit beta [Kitasatospora purpeofusca]|uniref:DNA-directed RNA polymerase subunit beta n=1 Tax=Kitasatospora purpeofusca TaxID=67352 RepID=UPI000A4432B7|nr:DNA-directed RNA polymerase subunit beta [Kitasatospora purpeofusca]MCX4753356.1 DNA-directed RNA polymerase subunit beta [Kitasatospora purpeofusca]WSR32864.1 DNA-directed RNA polymerase subunit beta [Kitasatospora purpeofusca]WSR40957.1 DNA-directed RNA polymerase subunit beta [Kitasatospora purpeofusca]
MAAPRNASNNSAASTAPLRVSFAKIKEPLEVPNLLALQTESFDWLLGNAAWKTRVERALDNGQDVPTKSGLEEIFEEISPIEDFSGSMSLTFRDHRFEPPKNSIDECKDRDFTFAAPLFVTAEFTNNETGEIKSQTVFMGDFPLMTHKGTFVINGTERVVVSQLVRSPGVYFDSTLDKVSDKDIYSCKVIPSRGAWLEMEIDKRDMVGVRIDRKRKQSVTVLLKALGWTNEMILEEFGEYESMRATLEKDHTQGQDDALLDIYRKLRPGEPPTREAAQTLLENLYFNPKRYDLAKVGRYKVNRKLGNAESLDSGVLTEPDIIGAIKYLVKLHAGEVEWQDESGRDIVVEVDDIDHFGNRRLRNVGELIQNQVRTGLARMERVVRERMTTQDVEAITPQTLINIRPVVASIKEFFGTSQLSQFMDQTNPLSGLTHKRRLSALGPGGLSRERAGFEVRDVHPSHYGRMCPIETPEGPNIGLIGSLASYGRVNAFGFIETPYRKVIEGVVTEQVDYLTADEEDRFVIAQANAPLTAELSFAEPRVLVRRRGGEIDYIPGTEIDYMDVSPRQMVSVATAMIPFLEHDDANRALMGSNMMRQAVPLLKSEAPLVGTGMEYRCAVDAADVITAEKAGVVQEVSADYVTVANDDGTYTTYRAAKFTRSNQGTAFNQKVLVDEGARVESGQVLADGPCTDEGEMALGKNLLVAFMSWEGHNYEDAIILSQRLVQDDVLSSIHIEEHEVDARDTKLGPEEITRDIPNVSEEVLADLDERGIIRIGADVVTGDILVGKVTPKGETELTPEERLLRAIFGEKAREVRDTSLKVPHGESGKVIGVRVFDREEGDELPPGVNQLVRVYVAQKRKITNGDKLAGRHGNKGVISKILPVEDMPFLEDGTPVDIILNPLGVPSRMNPGQVLEIHLGWLAKQGWDVSGLADEWAQRLQAIGADQVDGGTNLATPVFDGAREDEITGLLDHTTLTRDGERLVNSTGKARLFDGRSGEPFPMPVSVGYMYILKLHHLVDDKLHARSTGPYSMITQQPLGGKAQFGGQRFGEMEVWALEAYGAAYALQELLTIKSDDVLGRVKVYEAIVKGENIPEPGIPESFKVLIKEMQSLCLNVEVLSSDGQSIEMRDSDEDVFRAAEELGIDLSRREPSSVEEV